MTSSIRSLHFVSIFMSKPTLFQPLTTMRILRQLYRPLLLSGLTLSAYSFTHSPFVPLPTLGAALSRQSGSFLAMSSSSRPDHEFVQGSPAPTQRPTMSSRAIGADIVLPGCLRWWRERSRPAVGEIGPHPLIGARRRRAESPLARGRPGTP